jgi:DNA polymerase mu
MLLQAPPCFSRVKLSRYRRGKPASNDIDIVFTHGNAMSAKGLCARLVERLRSAGLVKHVMREYRPRRSQILFPPTRA